MMASQGENEWLKNEHGDEGVGKCCPVEACECVLSVPSEAEVEL